MIRRRIVIAILVFVLFLAPIVYGPSLAEPPITYLYTSEVTYTNLGETALTFEVNDLMANIFPNTSRQTTHLVEAYSSLGLVSDADSNPCLLFSSKIVPPSENITLNLSLQIRSMATAPPKISFEPSGELSDIPTNLGRYLESGGSTWQGDDLRIRALAQNISARAGNTRNVLRIVVAAADWVGQNIIPASHDLAYSPVETYLAREGDCDDQALLLIAILRSLGVPAYLQVGAIHSGRSERVSYWNDHVTSALTNIAYHGWAMVYVPPWGWLPLDMTLGWRRDDSLAVVGKAPVWSSDVLVMLNAVTMDWVGNGKESKEWVLSKNVSILIEDTLLRELSMFEAFRGVYPWLLAVTLLSVTLYIILDSLRRHSRAPT